MKQLGAGTGKRTRIFSLEGTYFARDFKDLVVKRVPGAPDSIKSVGCKTLRACRRKGCVGANRIEKKVGNGVGVVVSDHKVAAGVATGRHWHA